MTRQQLSLCPLLMLLLLCNCNCGSSSSGSSGLLLQRRVTEGSKDVNIDLLPSLRRALAATSAAADSSHLRAARFYNNDAAYPFVMDSGRLVLRGGLDREQLCRRGSDCEEDNECCRVLRIEVHDGVEDREFYVKIIVDDINDSRPKFESSIEKQYQSISESAQPGLLLDLPKATDDDSAANGIVEYRLDDKKPDSETFDRHFRLVDNHGARASPKLRLERSVDREVVEQLSCLLLAVDAGRPQLTGTVSITVSIKDVNDQQPRIENFRPGLQIRLNETQSFRRDTVAEFDVVDADSGENGRVTCRLQSADPQLSDLELQTLLEVKEARRRSKDRSYWRIGSLAQLDYERLRSASFLVVAADSGTHPMSASVTVSLTLLNVDDNPISISFLHNGKRKQRVQVQENLPARLKVASVEVRDRDVHDIGGYEAIECRLSEQSAKHFQLEKKSTQYSKAKEFKLRTKESLNREEAHELLATVTCRDRNRPDSPPTSASLVVTVGDVDDNLPTFSRRRYSGQVKENSAARTVVAMADGRVRAHDLDAFPNNRIHFRLVGKDAAPFVIDASGEISVASAELDYERKSSFLFNVTAFNHVADSARSSVAEVEVRVIDVNDNAPLMVGGGADGSGYSFEVKEEVKGVEIGRVNATDADTAPENHDVIYQLKDADHSVRSYFSVGRRSGVVTVKKQIDRERHSSFQFSILAKNQEKLQLEARQLASANDASTARVRVRVLNVNDHRPQLCSIGRGGCKRPGATIRVELTTAAGVVAGEPVSPDSAKCVVFKFEARDADAGQELEVAEAELLLANVTELRGSRRAAAEGVEFGLKGPLFCARRLPASSSLRQVFDLDLLVRDSQPPHQSTPYQCRVIVTRLAKRPPQPPPAPDPAPMPEAGDWGGAGHFTEAGVDRRNFVIIVTLVTIVVFTIVVIFAFVLFFFVKRYDASLEKEYEPELLTLPLHNTGTVRKPAQPLPDASPEMTSLLPRYRRQSQESNACAAGCGMQQQNNEIDIQPAMARYEMWRDRQQQKQHSQSDSPVVLCFNSSSSGSAAAAAAAAAAASSGNGSYQTIDPLAPLRCPAPPPPPPMQQQQQQHSEHSSSASATPAYLTLSSPLSQHQQLRAANTASTSLHTSAEPLCSPRKSLKAAYFETSFV